MHQLAVQKASVQVIARELGRSEECIRRAVVAQWSMAVSPTLPQPARRKPGIRIGKFTSPGASEY